jgi:hypothetical protein
MMLYRRATASAAPAGGATVDAEEGTARAALVSALAAARMFPA